MRTGTATAKVIAQASTHENMVISSFHPLALYRMRRFAPNVPRALIYQTKLMPSVLNGPWFRRSRSSPCASRRYPNGRCEVHGVGAPAGISVVAWHTERPEEMRRLIALGMTASCQTRRTYYGASSTKSNIGAVKRPNEDTQFGHRARARTRRRTLSHRSTSHSIWVRTELSWTCQSRKTECPCHSRQPDRSTTDGHGAIAEMRSPKSNAMTRVRSLGSSLAGRDPDTRRGSGWAGSTRRRQYRTKERQAAKCWTGGCGDRRRDRANAGERARHHSSFNHFALNAIHIIARGSRWAFCTLIARRFLSLHENAAPGPATALHPRFVVVTPRFVQWARGKDYKINTGP